MRFLVVALVACSSAKETRPTPAVIDRALERAGAFLAGQIGDDGAIRSETYAALKDGWSLTPMAVLALRMTPHKSAAYQRAVAFVATAGDAPRNTVSYPLYAYAIGAIALSTPESVDANKEARDRLLELVRGQQMGEANGWRPDDASFGGFGYAPDVPRRPEGAIKDDLLTANLSATMLAVGALALAGAPPDPAALGFVKRCQNDDGGFFFSPALPDGNKAGPAPGGGYRSYGSMTADGVRALLRLGVPRTDPALTKAAAWLEMHFDPTRNPGDFAHEIRRDSSYYYWTWSAAHALEHLGRPVLETSKGDVRWAEALAAELLRRQGADGAWRNTATEMREDDPVVATSFAVAALALCRGVLSNERPVHATWR